MPTQVYPGDATLGLAVMFLDLSPWVTEGMKCILALASQRRKYHRLRGFRGCFRAEELLNEYITRDPMLLEFNVQGAMQRLLIWYCSVQAQFIVGVGRSCWLE